MAEAVTEVTTMPEALVNTALGMGTVFCVLILISFIIYLFKFIPKLINRERKTEAVQTPAAKPSVAREVKEEKPAAKAAKTSEDGQIIAVIAAAVAAQMTEETGVPVTADGLVIRSINKRTLSN